MEFCVTHPVFNPKVRFPSGTSPSSVCTVVLAAVALLPTPLLLGTCCKTCFLGAPALLVAGWCHLWVTLSVGAKWFFWWPTEPSQHHCICQGAHVTECSSSAKDKRKDALVRSTSSAEGQVRLEFGPSPTQVPRTGADQFLWPWCFLDYFVKKKSHTNKTHFCFQYSCNHSYFSCCSGCLCLSY